ncbi:MAG: GntR family transcriptional regulator [Pseudomonadota bacterium]
MSVTAPAREHSATIEGVARQIEQAILDHRLAPGTKLTEDEIASIYGIGRTIVRGALQALTHKGLVEIRRNRGAFVAKPSVREACEVFEARALLEPRTARSAAERARAADVRILHRHIEQEHAALDAGNTGRAVYLSGEFHVAIARIADQTTIENFIYELIARSSLIVALYWRRRDALCESHAHHALVDAIANGDGALAEELMTSHLVDLRSCLDLSETPAPPKTLRDALG